MLVPDPKQLTSSKPPALGSLHTHLLISWPNVQSEADNLWNMD